MKYSYEWLKEYYRTKDTVEKTAALITELGAEVESTDEVDSDVVLEAEVTPNRGDLLSHFGMARDLSAQSGKLINKPEMEIKESGKKSSDEIQVETKSGLCSLYIARVIRGVKVTKSPEWLQSRLVSCGIKPVNNVVDVTNYIMLDLGHPLHAFDPKKIEHKTIIVKEVEKEQEVMCLDDKARVLLPGMICIYDAKKPIAIAGVMGLKCSEIDEQTIDVVLEAAVFNPQSVRKTAKLLGVKTEASYRFERGVDDRGTSYAVKKAAQIIAEIAGGEIYSGEVVAGKLAKQTSVKIEYPQISALAGADYSQEQIDTALKSLGFEINENFAYVPSWRHDVSIWQDLAEEVMRLQGLDKIKPEALDIKASSDRGKYFKKEQIKDYLVEMGLDEAITYTFLSEEDIKTAKLKADNLLAVANPVQVENRYLRNSLIPGLLKVVAKAPSFDDIEIFEIGHTFDKLNERELISIVTAGKAARQAQEIVGSLAKKIKTDPKLFNVYELNRDELKRFKIKKPHVYVAEAELQKLLETAQFDSLKIMAEFAPSQYRPISKYPPLSRDLAFVLDAKYVLGEIRDVIVNASDKVVLAEPFDEYKSERFGAGKKSVAFHIYLQNMDKTMSDEEAEGEIDKIIKSLQNELKAQIRK